MKTEIAVFGGGCFWCTEAVYIRLKGVLSVTSGFAGGTKPNPTYEDVVSGMTGHAEVIQVEFDPAIISYNQLLEVFFATHNPTTLNQQMYDMGTQYRSIILYTSDTQKQEAEAYTQQLEKEKAFDNPIVTEIAPLEQFYPAGDYQQNFYENNKLQPYCQIIIDPKVAKFEERFKDLLKK